MLPHEFPPWKTVYNYFQAWAEDGTLDEIVATLRVDVRVKEGREPTPSTGSIDSQSVKTAEGGEDRGYDAGKKINGRKRHIFVDSLGLLLAVVVTAASVDDAEAAKDAFASAESECFPRLNVVWADSKYHNYDLYDWIDEHTDYQIHIVRRPSDAKGFVVLPKRWIVERTFAWLTKSRRLSKDYERSTSASEAMIKISAIQMMLNRLAPANAQYECAYNQAA